MIRGNPAAVAAHAEALLDISGAHEMPMFAAYGAVNAAWARARMGGGDAPLAEMRAAWWRLSWFARYRLLLLQILITRGIATPHKSA